MSRRLKRIAITVLAVSALILYYILRNINSDNVEHERTPRLAVIVPFRDRFDELIMFVPNLSKFLQSQNLDYRIYIVNQSRKYRFNRGALSNVGFLLTRDKCDYIAIHDVDLLPLNSNLSYAYPSKGPFHLASPKYHPQYNYDKYFGGILLIKNDHFEFVNGMSNRYFGWGLEDDEFFTRVRAAKLKIFRPNGLSTDKSSTFIHLHYGRKRDTFRTKLQREKLKRRDTITGLKDLKFSLTSSHNLTIDEHYDCTLFNVEIHCDTEQTPWCVANHTQLVSQDQV